MAVKTAKPKATPKPKADKPAAAPKPKTEKASASAPAAPKPRQSVPVSQNVKATAELFKQVSDATRLTVIGILEDGPQNVTELTDALGMSQPALSHHLALMRHAGVVQTERTGKNNYYALTDKGRALCKAVSPLLSPSA